MYGLDSLTEHSTVNVEFSRESVSFMWKDRGLGPGKMGRGGKGGKPGGSSKRVESGRNNGKLLLDARYSLQLKKGLREKDTKRGAGAGNSRYGAGRSVAPVSTVLFSRENLCFPYSKVGLGENKNNRFLGYQTFHFLLHFLVFSRSFLFTSRCISLCDNFENLRC